ncbi:MAG: arsenite efflux transporter metallochaperone ArsD [Deltaproteobacteria bacterium]|nr:arsenite efflux transporter metallochaperone ArsD [Candidatus Deferrimicrobium borealis]
MRKLEIFEPPMCCPTGVCGPAPDPALSNLQESILRWKKDGIDVERIAINQVPQRFVANPTVVDLLTREGQEVLPIALLDGKVVCKGKYPTYDQVAREEM